MSMKTEKASEKVSCAADIRDDLHEAMTCLAGPRLWSDTRESWIGRAARRAGISYRTAKALLYREIKDPKWSVVQAVTQAAARLCDDETQEALARDDISILARRVAEMEAALAHMASAPATGEGASLHGSRGTDRAVVEGEARQ